ncbi:MAG: 4Fe-4S binding protein [Pseudodesulfovibrio sp.]|uniref:4Fe-4S ferredoxin iron-sulfur binding domain protein n=1 Tax=Pseudodesulfovibrio aespoeensis (strain ATCC 700646 / DSM 10631 / Aspo-2) TaxID=643562 RepID=E6VUR6_PSEA9|nr:MULTISPECIES: 4Fe-4S binding protein [Pseudodesulfovibrio]MBU4379863.1 4Fe-4S binding protein [Pseudomonadota bacterium]ADU62307.1 4Fe-4S ferredoxin iron-sulfur binding domain protein [Pseudodesulfovibrio aespoeensis Aspo-2]MBU4474028.1 4Fe-4S binding protein [Pseudomonadota bacterium]MBU4515226.1 4Fe-4S binding protein [Pseudomonadota bacterium]MBU4521131.1 4Fe-4S binding protein [Pseudomonadota bacterium]
MNALRKHVIQPIIDCWSLLVGLKITGKYFCQPLITVHYPRQVIDDENLSTYGGHVELIGMPKDPATPKCISCMMCVTNCPSNCLKVVKSKPPVTTPEQEQAWKEAEERGEKVTRPKGPKYPAKFMYDYTLCSLCGTCIDNCPANTLRFSNNIYWVATSRKEMHIDLLARLREKATDLSAPAPKTEAKPAAAEKEA